MTSGLTQAVDTVEQAAATPDQPQPFRELGLKDDEYQRIRDILGRRPTDAELAMYSYGSGALPRGVEGGLDAQTVYRD